MDDARGNQVENTGYYTPVAIYYQESDSLEYVRRDEPCIYRRVDQLLTLVLSMKSREPLGFRLKGFRHFYLRRISNHAEDEAIEFPLLVSVLEEAMSQLGGKIFDEEETLSAYAKARTIAEEDRVILKDFARVA